MRVYVPLDLNKATILRRLHRIIHQYGKANEGNEMVFSMNVNILINQIEIYDQILYVRHMSEAGRHSKEAKILVEAFVTILESILDRCTECFPCETIDDLIQEYLDP